MLVVCGGALVLILNARLKVLLLLVAAAALGVEGATHGLKTLSLTTKHFFKFAQVLICALVVVYGGRLILTRAWWPETRLRNDVICH